MRVSLRIAVVGLVAALGLFGCGGETGPTGANESELNSYFPNDKPAYDFFISKGLKNFQAAGIVGNLDQESGVDPGAVQYGGPGRGIAQWSVGDRWDTARGDNLQAFASSRGESSGSLNAQLEFIWYELTTFSGFGLASLRGPTTVRDASIAFQNLYEICGQCDEGTRITYAQSVLRAYGSTTAPPPMKVQCGLNANEAITAGQSVASCDKRFELSMQTDGNLVLYQLSPFKAIWATMTQRQGGYKAFMQDDGNFVLYTVGGVALWSTHTYGNPGSALALQNDGNLVLYEPGNHAAWSSHTCCR